MSSKHQKGPDLKRFMVSILSWGDKISPHIATPRENNFMYFESSSVGILRSLFTCCCAATRDETDVLISHNKTPDIYDSKDGGILVKFLKLISHNVISVKQILLNNFLAVFLRQDKKLKLSLNGNRKVVGTLRGYDPFLNVVLEEASYEKGEGGTEGIGTIVIRGNSIIQFESVDRITS